MAALQRPCRPVLMEVAVHVLRREGLGSAELVRIVRTPPAETTAVALGEAFGTGELSMVGVSHVGS